jgi:hypothetical protein
VRLKNLLLNKETLQTLKQYVIENWYFCVLMFIVFFIFMGIFIKCCAVHTPSSNPKKAPARRISDTLRRPMNTLRRIVSKIILLPKLEIKNFISKYSVILNRRDIFLRLDMVTMSVGIEVVVAMLREVDKAAVAAVL